MTNYLFTRTISPGNWIFWDGTTCRKKNASFTYKFKKYRSHATSCLESGITILEFF